jgi:hypothetical protein
MAYYNINIINNVTFGLVGGTYGATGLGIIDGGQILAIASVVLGIAAMVAALIVKNQLQKKKVGNPISIEMR